MMGHYCKVGDVVRYIRTDAVYLLIDVGKDYKGTIKHRKKGETFEAFVIYSGRSYTKNGERIMIFIPTFSDYYVVISPATGGPL